MLTAPRSQAQSGRTSQCSAGKEHSCATHPAVTQGRKSPQKCGAVSAADGRHGPRVITPWHERIPQINEGTIHLAQFGQEHSDVGTKVFKLLASKGSPSLPVSSDQVGTPGGPFFTRPPGFGWAAASLEEKFATLTIINRFTRWPEAIPLSQTNMAAVAREFVTNWIAHFGVPADICDYLTMVHSLRHCCGKLSPSSLGCAYIERLPITHKQMDSLSIFTTLKSSTMGLTFWFFIFGHRDQILVM